MKGVPQCSSLENVELVKRHRAEIDVIEVRRPGIKQGSNFERVKAVEGYVDMNGRPGQVNMMSLLQVQGKVSLSIISSSPYARVSRSLPTAIFTHLSYPYPTPGNLILPDYTSDHVDKDRPFSRHSRRHAP